MTCHGNEVGIFFLGDLYNPFYGGAISNHSLSIPEKNMLILPDHQNWEFHICSKQELFYWFQPFLFSL